MLTPYKYNAIFAVVLCLHARAERPDHTFGPEDRQESARDNFASHQKPNIVIFMADDLGRTDLSFTEGNLQTPTPNIDRLAWDGIILNRHYSQAICTPTRAAFLTGKYPFHVGMQTSIIHAGEPFGLPLEFPTQADLFRTLGYKTWHVGKWHLGEYQRAYYPENRGFDYSYSIVQGDCNWFNYTAGNTLSDSPFQIASGRAFRENGRMIFANITNNGYMPELLNNKAEQLIRDSDPRKPFYLYFTTPVPHTAYEPIAGSLMTMPEFQLRPPVLGFSDAFPGRKRLLGIIQALDESFKRVTDALVNKGVMNNTIIVFFADNGAAEYAFPNNQRDLNFGVNWPLRMGKDTMFEGGIRTSAFIWSPILKKRGRISTQLFHMTDWMPTLWEAAGGDPAALPANGDGYSQWSSFQSGYSLGPRKEIVVNIDTIRNQYGFILEDSYGSLFKLVGGLVNGFLGWNRPNGTAANDNSWKTYSPAQVDCVFPEGEEVTVCNPAVADCLFDLIYDPCETNNIAGSSSAMLKLIQQKLRAYNATSYPAVNKPFDPASDATLWQGLWVPWLEPSGEIYDRVPLTYAPFSPSTAF